jgi:hypothetical protein
MFLILFFCFCSSGGRNFTETQWSLNHLANKRLDLDEDPQVSIHHLLTIHFGFLASIVFLWCDLACDFVHFLGYIVPHLTISLGLAFPY